MLKKVFAFLLVIVLILSLISCADTNKNEKKTIVCLEFVSYDWAKAILGEITDSFNLVLLNESGKDMHSFEPSVNDLVKISNADLVIYMGGISEDWLNDFSVKNGIRNLSLLDVFLKSELVDKYEIDFDDVDEHIFLSLDIPKLLVESISKEISLLDPKNSEFYEKNTSKWIDDFINLGEEFEAKKPLIVVDRFPFEYLACDMGIEFIAAFDGCSSETEASFEVIVELANALNENDVDTIFILENSNDKLAKQVISTSNKKDTKIAVLNSIQSINSKDIEEGVTYFSLLSQDLDAIKEAVN